MRSAAGESRGRANGPKAANGAVEPLSSKGKNGREGGRRRRRRPADRYDNYVVITTIVPCPTRNWALDRSERMKKFKNVPGVKFSRGRRGRASSSCRRPGGGSSRAPAPRGR